MIRVRLRPVERSNRPDMARSGRGVPAGVAACVLAVSLLGMQPAAGADREQPVNLEADRVTIDDARQLAVFEGNVVLKQGTLEIRGTRMEVRQDKAGMSRGTTWGNPAYFRQQREGSGEVIEGWAQRIEYDSRREVMQMFHDARLKRGQDEVRGHYISYDGRSEIFQVTGQPKSGSKDGGEGRVRAIIQPKSKKEPSASPPANPKSSEGVARPRGKAAP